MPKIRKSNKVDQKYMQEFQFLALIQFHEAHTSDRSLEEMQASEGTAILKMFQRNIVDKLIMTGGKIDDLERDCFESVQIADLG